MFNVESLDKARPTKLPYSSLYSPKAKEWWTGEYTVIIDQSLVSSGNKNKGTFFWKTKGKLEIGEEKSKVAIKKKRELLSGE